MSILVRHFSPSLIPLCISLLWGSVAELSSADTVAARTKKSFFEQRYHAALERYREDESDAAATIEYAAAAFDQSNLANQSSERAHIAKPAIASCRQLLTRSPSHAQGSYYLALNLGQLARTRWLGALKIVAEMEKRLLTAKAQDPQQDFAGPDRALGRLYFQAPGWPASIGHRKKGIDHLHQAITTAPDYPGNHLFYLEMLVSTKRFKTARSHMAVARAAIQRGRSQLTSEYWSYRWTEWDGRWQSLQEQLAAKID